MQDTQSSHQQLQQYLDCYLETNPFGDCDNSVVVV
jgi:hypothetical protein